MSARTRDYKIHEAVCRGPYGVIHRATEVGRGKTEVLVQLLEGADNAAVVAALRLQMSASAELRHPFVARPLAIQDVEGRSCLIYEYSDGLTLGGLLGRAPIPVRTAVEIGGKLARALHAAFKKSNGKGPPLGLVHGDLSPDQIWLARGGLFKVMGFGLKPSSEPRDRDAARARLACPTAYTAPEAQRGVDLHASDVYALGAILSHTITGVTPSYASSQRDWHDAVVSSVTTRVREISGEDSLAKLISELMSFEPAGRPQADEIEKRMEGLRRNQDEPRIYEWCDRVIPRVKVQLAEELTLAEATLPSGPLFDETEEIPYDDALVRSGWDSLAQEVERRAEPATQLEASSEMPTESGGEPQPPEPVTSELPPASNEPQPPEADAEGPDRQSLHPMGEEPAAPQIEDEGAPPGLEAEAAPRVEVAPEPEEPAFQTHTLEPPASAPPPRLVSTWSLPEEEESLETLPADNSPDEADEALDSDDGRAATSWRFLQGRAAEQRFQDDADLGRRRAPIEQITEVHSAGPRIEAERRMDEEVDIYHEDETTRLEVAASPDSLTEEAIAASGPSAGRSASAPPYILRGEGPAPAAPPHLADPAHVEQVAMPPVEERRSASLSPALPLRAAPTFDAIDDPPPALAGPTLVPFFDADPAPEEVRPVTAPPPKTETTAPSKAPVEAKTGREGKGEKAGRSEKAEASKRDRAARASALSTAPTRPAERAPADLAPPEPFKRVEPKPQAEERSIWTTVAVIAAVLVLGFVLWRGASGPTAPEPRDTKGPVTQTEPKTTPPSAPVTTPPVNAPTTTSAPPVTPTAPAMTPTAPAATATETAPPTPTAAATKPTTTPATPPTTKATTATKSATTATTATKSATTATTATKPATTTTTATKSATTATTATKPATTTTTATKPATTAAATTAPPPSKASGIPENPPAGTLSVKGDAQSVKLVSAAGSFSAGPLPAGTYSVKATFEGGTGPIDAGTVTVNAGQTVTVSCDTAFARCKIR